MASALIGVCGVNHEAAGDIITSIDTRTRPPGNFRAKNKASWMGKWKKGACPSGPGTSRAEVAAVELPRLEHLRGEPALDGTTRGVPTGQLDGGCDECAALLAVLTDCTQRLVPVPKRPREPSPPTTAPGSPAAKRSATGEGAVGSPGGKDTVASPGGDDAVGSPGGDHEPNTPAFSGCTSLEMEDASNWKRQQQADPSTEPASDRPPPLQLELASDDPDALAAVGNFLSWATCAQLLGTQTDEPAHAPANALVLLATAFQENPRMCEGMLVPMDTWSKLRVGECRVLGAGC